VRPLAVHHVSINVDDLGAAAGFYVDILGLSRRNDRPDLAVDGMWLDAGAQQVHLMRPHRRPPVGSISRRWSTASTPRSPSCAASRWR
jgi:catechol 2,3-dioxygenase-like lactoylglutathione lyase family enzyme